MIVLLKQCFVKIVPKILNSTRLIFCLVSCKQEGTRLTTHTKFIFKSSILITSDTNISIHCAFKKCFYRIHHTDEIFSSLFFLAIANFFNNTAGFKLAKPSLTLYFLIRFLFLSPLNVDERQHEEAK